ncbi:UTRO protein, partial [Rhinopomastus cyanomelas]|nr:UTRO protein [Rhinopomastus cyanomelas]
MARVPDREDEGPGGSPGEFSDIIKSRSDEHNDVQKKTFTKWINARFSKSGKPPVKDMFTDLKDGRRLLDLLEGLTGKPLPKERGSTRVHALNNVNRVLQVLHQNNVELVNIGGTDIVDGNHKLTLGLLWSIILHWQVKDVMKNIMSDLQQTNSEKILLSWVRQSTRPYSQVNVLNFTTSWADGLAFNAVIHRHRPELFSWDRVTQMSAAERLEHAFSTAKHHLGIERLLDPEDVAVQLPDKKSIIMYLTSLFEVLPKQVTMEDIWEVETLPRKYKQECEDGDFSTQQVRLEEERGSPRAETPSTVTEVDVDLDSYQVALEEVLTWLLSAEDVFREQEEVSGDVEEVKEQFSAHEAFMMELTAHQSSVGSVLQAGNQLVTQGNLSPEEEFEIQEQMLLLNSRWEELRVESMDRQSRLHDLLTELQKQQLQQLSDWLAVTEERIRKMESQPVAEDLESLRGQLEEHKNLQSDLEAEQVKVNSLTHMVVIVDESSGEGATAVLEEQLQRLGERWTAVCRWTEERRARLQEIQLLWQELLEEQCLLKAWLTEKEEALSRVQTGNFRDPAELTVNVRKLAILREDMGMKRPTLDQLNELGQDVAQVLGSSGAASRIDEDQEELTQRWDSLVQKLEDYSNEITQAVGGTGAQTAAAEAAPPREPAVAERCGQEAPPPPPKRRQSPGDSEAKKRFDTASAELLGWISTAKSAVQAADIGGYRKMRDTSDLKERLEVVEKERLEASQKLDELKRSGQVLLDQMGKEGLSAADVKAVMEKVSSGWKDVAQHLEEVSRKIQCQDDINVYFEEMGQLERAVAQKDDWLRSAASSAAQPAAVLRDLCQQELSHLASLSPGLERLRATCGALASRPAAPGFVGDSLAALLDHFQATRQRLEEHHQQLQKESQPSPEYVESLQQLKDELDRLEREQQCGTSGLGDPSQVERALQQAKLLCESLEAQKPRVDKLAEETKALERLAAGDVKEVYVPELQRVQGRWDRLKVKSSRDVKLLEEIASKLRTFESGVQVVQKWLDGVKDLLASERALQGDADGLQRQLDQCT